MKGALRSCRALLNDARSLGDEPFLVTQLVRIMGAGVTYPQNTTGGSALTGFANGAGATTGAYVLALADLPAHHHRLWVGQNKLQYTSSGGNTAIVGPQGQNGGSYQTLAETGSGTQMVEDTGGGGGHQHTVTGVSHQHTSLPPYRALVPIMRM